MSDLRVSVALHPVTHDEFLPRKFTLSADNTIFAIGRSSNRSLRRRAPEPDNGWFESRVMSRDHAQFSLCLEKKILYICDTGSTHGTWLNNIKLIEGEKTPLIHGDVLRFGVDVDRGDEEFPALAVCCKIDWTEVNKSPTPPNPPAAELEAPFESNPLLTLRPSCSTNTFCVPDDSDVEEVPNLTTKFADEAAAVFHQVALQASQDLIIDDDSVVEVENNHENLPTLVIENADYANAESAEEVPDFGSESPDSSSFSYTSSDIEANPDEDDMRAGYSESEPDSESEVESDSDPEAETAIENLVDSHDECINPVMLIQNDESTTFTLDNPSTGSEDVARSRIPVETETTKPLRTTLREVLEAGSAKRHPHPHSVVQDEPQGASLNLQSGLASADHEAYEEGPFSYIDIGPEETSSNHPISKSTDASLKRKASEMDSQDEQIVESVRPATQENLETIPRPEVVEAISSALSEGQPPKKRAKSSHPSSGNVASYTATAVISALLGGLGTIALLAALPAEYFQ